MTTQHTCVDASEVRRLQRLRSVGSVSVLLHCSGRWESDRPTLDSCVREAQRRLVDEVSPGDADVIVQRLESLCENADMPGSASLALFASVEHQAIFALDVQIPTRVVVDDTYATRDLVLASHRQAEYQLITLGSRLTRRFEGRGRHLSEVHGGGFPLRDEASEREQRTDRARSADLELYGREVERLVMSELPDDGRPIILAGTPRRVAAVGARPRLARQPVTRVDHNLERAEMAEIRDVVSPILDRLLAERQDAAISAAHAAVGQHRGAVGILSAWEAAVSGRVQHLVVERGYRVGARMHPDGRTFTRTDDVTAPGVIDDLVDELIELTLARSGGVTIVDDGALSHAERLAAILRY